MVYLEDGDIAEFGRQDYRVIRPDGTAVTRSVHQSSLSADAVELGQYRHYMQKEIFEQPQALAPGCAINVSLWEGRVFFSEGPGCFVRIEVLASVLANGHSADAALPRSIDAGEHMNARQSGSAHARLRTDARCFRAALTAARPSSTGEA